MYMLKKSQELNEDGIEKCQNALELKCDFLSLRGLSPRANYTNRAAAAGRRS